MARPFDVAIVADLRFPGGTSAAIAAEIDAQSAAGYRTALIAIKAPVLKFPHPIHPLLRAHIDAGAPSWSTPRAAIDAGLALVHHPQVLTHLPRGRLRVQAEQHLLVAHHPPFDADGEPFYDWRRIDHHAAALFGGRSPGRRSGPSYAASCATWASAGEPVAAGLAQCAGSGGLDRSSAPAPARPSSSAATAGRTRSNGRRPARRRCWSTRPPPSSRSASSAPTRRSPASSHLCRRTGGCCRSAAWTCASSCAGSTPTCSTTIRAGSRRSGGPCSRRWRPACRSSCREHFRELFGEPPSMPTRGGGGRPAPAARRPDLAPRAGRRGPADRGRALLLGPPCRAPAGDPVGAPAAAPARARRGAARTRPVLHLQRGRARPRHPRPGDRQALPAGAGAGVRDAVAGRRPDRGRGLLGRVPAVPRLSRRRHQPLEPLPRRRAGRDRALSRPAGDPVRRQHALLRPGAGAAGGGAGLGRLGAARLLARRAAGPRRSSARAPSTPWSSPRTWPTSSTRARPPGIVGRTVRRAADPAARPWPSCCRARRRGASSTLPADGPCFLVQLGAGNNFDFGPVQERILARLGEVPGATVAVLASPISHGPVPDRGRAAGPARVPLQPLSAGVRRRGQCGRLQLLPRADPRRRRRRCSCPTSTR